MEVTGAGQGCDFESWARGIPTEVIVVSEVRQVARQHRALLFIQVKSHDVNHFRVNSPQLLILTQSCGTPPLSGYKTCPHPERKSGGH